MKRDKAAEIYKRVLKESHASTRSSLLSTAIHGTPGADAAAASRSPADHLQAARVLPLPPMTLKPLGASTVSC